MRYIYYETGHVANITIKDVSDDFYYDLALYYTSDGKLWRVLWDKWKVTGESITNYDTIKAREFYYDGPRQRYLVREVDPDTWAPTATAQLWTDYNGVLPYGDFELTFDQGDPVTDETMRYLAGSGVQAQQTLDGQDDPEAYLHGDLIGSTMLTTDEDGDADQTLAYTAFGEPIGTIPTGFPRYQYAGGNGYESGLLTLEGASGTLPITLQHLGARWYQPDIGRFVQRDPIGLGGGLNLYVYCKNIATSKVDPSGLQVTHPKFCPRCGKVFCHCWDDYHNRAVGGGFKPAEAWDHWSATKGVRQGLTEAGHFIRDTASKWAKGFLWASRFTFCFWLIEIEGDDYRPEYPPEMLYPDLYDPSNESIYPEREFIP